MQGADAVENYECGEKAKVASVQQPVEGDVKEGEVENEGREELNERCKPNLELVVSTMGSGGRVGLRVE